MNMRPFRPEGIASSIENRYIQMKKATIIILTFLSLNAFAQTKSQVSVEVNPEVSLFGIVTYLSGNITFVIPSSYQELVKTTFKPYKKHPAVSEIKKLYKGKNAEIESIHPMLGLYCTALPELRPIYSNIKNVSADELENYLKYLRNFSDETAYKSFLEHQKTEFSNWTKPVQDSITKYQLADRLGNLFGQHKTFKICLDPFNSWGGQAFVPDDTTFTNQNAWFILGYNIYRKDGSDKTKSPKFDNMFMLIDLVWHEGAHTYINPRLDTKAQLFEPYQKLLDDNLQEKLQKAGRFKWKWSQFLKEQITRATVAYLQQKYFGDDAWKKECERQENIGFIYTQDLSELIKKYDENKSTYTDFADFLPEIASYFEYEKKLHKVDQVFDVLKSIKREN